MLCCCERDEQTASRIMSDHNIDLGEWGVSSVPALTLVLLRGGCTNRPNGSRPGAQNRTAKG